MIVLCFESESKLTLEDSIYISDVNSSSNGKEEYKLFIEKIVGAMDSLSD